MDQHIEDNPVHAAYLILPEVQDTIASLVKEDSG